MMGFWASCGNSSEQTEAKEEKPAYEHLAKVEWLLGRWQNTSEEGTVSESWSKADDSTFRGSGLFMMGTDTLSKEELRLEQRGEELFYVPTVKNQNEGKAVRFKMTSLTEKTVVFENPEHDFPQKITYARVTNDSLQAEISGKLNGKPNSQSFSMSRAK